MYQSRFLLLTDDGFFLDIKPGPHHKTGRLQGIGDNVTIIPRTHCSVEGETLNDKWKVEVKVKTDCVNCGIRQTGLLAVFQVTGKAADWMRKNAQPGEAMTLKTKNYLLKRKQ